jgi:hypothetical protein
VARTGSEAEAGDPSDEEDDGHDPQRMNSEAEPEEKSYQQEGKDDSEHDRTPC